MIKFVLEEGAYLPVREHAEDAGIDLRTPVRIALRPHSAEHIDLRIRVEIPKGYVGLLTSKSGLMSKRNIKTTGTIDSGYSGTVGVTVFNHSDDVHIIEKGDKVTQLVILPCLLDPVEIVEHIKGGERGEKGFGSTGD